MASRLLYGMARQGVIPGFLGKVLPGRRTPWAAIIFALLADFALGAKVPGSNAGRICPFITASDCEGVDISLSSLSDVQ